MVDEEESTTEFPDEIHARTYSKPGRKLVSNL